MGLPRHGRPADDVLADLDRMKRADVAWKEGRAFSLAYFPGHEVMAVADAAYSRFSSDNALNVGAFPSLREIQHDVVDIVRGWTGGDVDAAGFMTTGGTESLLLAVKAARQRGRRERGIDDPNIVLPTSAHAAFEKACHYFGLESRRVAVGADWRADPAAIDAAIDDRTVLVVASAPQYPQGVIDPISEIAALAAVRDINCHVDACMGGVVLPYLSRLDVEVPPWNFAVDGVTQHLRRPAQVRLYHQGRLRSDPPQPHTARRSDVRHGQLVGWSVRLVGSARLEGRRGDGCRMGGDAPPRRRRLPAPHRRRPPSCGRFRHGHRRPSGRCGCSHRPTPRW